MSRSKVVVSILAALCLATAADAAIITVQGANCADISGWGTTYTTGLNQKGIGGNIFYYAQYNNSDLTAALADPNVGIVSATMFYSWGYRNNKTGQGTMTVSEPLLDYTLDTGTSVYTAYHIAMVGGNRNAPVLPAVRLCSAIETQSNPGTTDPYRGTHSIDVTAIVQDWKTGAESYNHSMGMGWSLAAENLSYGSFMPYLSIETAPIPEPATMGLLLIGGIAALVRRRQAA